MILINFLDAAIINTFVIIVSQGIWYYLMASAFYEENSIGKKFFKTILILIITSRGNNELLHFQ